MRPNFKNIDIKNAGFAATNAAEWAKANGIEANWKTPEHIEVKPVYTKEDLEGMEHLNYASGLPPYLRGPYSGMYAMRPWTIRQYAGFSTAEESNAFYRRNLASGQNDNERCRTSCTGILYQCRFGTGRQVGRDGRYDPKRYPERIHGA